MATTIGRMFRLSILTNSRSFNKLLTRKGVTIVGVGCGAVLAAGAAWTTRAKLRTPLTPTIYAKDDGSRAVEKKAALQTQRELRFLSFASLEYEGQVFMTPLDFLESVTEDAPRPRSGRKQLRHEEVDKILKNTPSKWKGSSHFFRNLDDRGIISYTEYLFLICVLTKPQSGFRIAFNMFDTDGNQRVDKKEFLVMEKVILGNNDDQDGDATSQDTTLTIHLFGRRGTEVLKYEDFYRFMENLQTESMELEFNEFSKGFKFITEEDFARCLLRYTVLSPEEIQEYLERLSIRIKDTKGISFEDFKDFGQFLNSLDDFNLAMRIYTYADQPISEEDFKRAVKAVTGHNLASHLVHVVFQLFDIDGDGQLSHKEFVSVMKDRLHRGFRAQPAMQTRKDIFKNCLRSELKR